MNAAQIAALLPFQPYWLPNLALWLDPSRQVFTDSAGSFATGSNQYLFIADNVSVSGGNVDQWGSAMVSLASKPGTLNMCILTKDNQSTVRERVIGWAQGDRFFATLYDGASTAVATVTANTFGAPSLATWYFVFWYFDATAGTIGISINGGAFDTASKTGNPGTNSQQYRVGGPSARSWDGQLESVGFGKNLPGGFATTTPSTIRDMLWNGGSPRKLSSLTSAERTAIGITIGSLDSAQASLTADAIGSNTLTNNNAVTVGAGAILTPAYPGSVEGTQRDLVTNLAFAQTTYANRSLLGVASTGAMYSLFDGTNDSLVGSDAGFPSGAAPRSVFLVACPAVLTGSAFGYGTYVATQMNEIFISASTWRWSQNGTTVNIAAAVANRTDVVGFTFDGSLTRTYLNGSPGGTSSATVATVLGQAVIGNEPSPSAGYRFNGRIGQIVVFNRVLSTAEIQRLTAFLGQKALI